MKKKWMTAVLLLSVGAFAVCGCGKNTDKTDTDSKTESASVTSSESSSSVAGYTSPEEIDGAPVVEEEVPVSECVTLGEYKGITLEKKVEKVTDEQVEQAMLDDATITIEDPEEPVKEGDTVDIAYVGKIDGKEFEGGSSDSYNLTIGSDTFIDGFEDGVIGMKTDETKNLNLKFPDNYGNADLAGKDVVFTVTVNAITRPAGGEEGWEFTDEWVQKNTDCSTVEEFRTEKRDQLTAANEKTAESDLESTALETVVRNSAFHKIPRSYVMMGENSYDSSYAYIASNYYGMKLEDYLEQYMDVETYNSQKAEYAKNMAESAVVIKAIEEAEGWSTEDQEYQSMLNDAAANAGMSTEDYLKNYGEENAKLSIMMHRAIRLVLDQADIQEVSVDPSGDQQP